MRLPGLIRLLVDLSAGLVNVTNRLVEDVTKSIGRGFRADYDYFAWLIRGGHRAGGSFRRRCWLSSCLLLCSRRARLRKRPRRDQRAGESLDCFLYHECLPFLTLLFYPNLRGSGFHGRRPNRCRFHALTDPPQRCSNY